ncbi:MAG: DUF1501 domain-containing protein [Verrucomicrobiae bacterium]|jgi:hypothetical protein|nr:DUF1501 domain-containing protein [Verrucomicrobiae bacterium]
MLRILGKSNPSLCDGVRRRDFLRVGALGMGGLALPRLLQAEAAAGLGRSQKAVIMIYLVGAPPHQDMYDLKEDAPSEIRGEFKSISTNVPGIRICEHLPRLAGIMDKLVPLRSVHGSPNGAHDSHICYTGRDWQNPPPGGWPAIGPVISKVLGHYREAVPPFVGLAPRAGHPPYGSPGLPGFLGPASAAFSPSGPGREDLVLRDIDGSRLDDRKGLLADFDRFRRDTDASGTLDALDTFQQRALGMLTSSRIADALDLSKEDPKIRERYGKGDPRNYGDGAPRNLEHFLLARRLVEAGARCVTLNFGRWDFHSNNFSEAKNTHLPLFDQGMSALVEDIYARGMQDDVSIVAWGEFGRTPTINKDAGRDHWPRVGGGLLSGGGFKTGQVLGATDRLGGEIADRPIHFGEVHASLYRQLGIDPHKTQFTDHAGRPHPLVDYAHQPLPELI